jgi:hypothetical protein
MEPESGKDRRTRDPEEVEQERISREQRETTLPFAGEGLEQSATAIVDGAPYRDGRLLALKSSALLAGGLLPSSCGGTSSETSLRVTPALPSSSA